MFVDIMFYWTNLSSIIPHAQTNLLNHLFQTFTHLGLVHTVRVFLIATAILLIATNVLSMTQWKCSHNVTATTSPTPIQPIMSKNISQSQIANGALVNRDVEQQNTDWMVPNSTLSHTDRPLRVKHF